MKSILQVLLIGFLLSGIVGAQTESAVFLENGKTKLEKSDFKEAINDFTIAFKLDSGLTEALLYRGIALTHFSVISKTEKRYEEAISDFSKAIEMKPNYAEAYCKRGITYSIIGKTENALADFIKAVEIKPDYTEAYYEIGLGFLNTGDAETAATEFSKALDIEKNYYPALIGRSSAYIKLSRYKESLADINSAIELKNYLADYIKRAEIKELLNDYRGAVKDYTKAIEVDPDNAPFYYELRGKVKEKTNDINGAIKDYSQAASGNLSNSASAYYLSGRAKYRTGKLMQAVEDLTKAMVLSEAQFYRGLAKAKLLDYRGASEDLELFLKSDASKYSELFPEAYYFLGLSKCRTGFKDEGCIYFSKAGELGYTQAYSAIRKYCN